MTPLLLNVSQANLFVEARFFPQPYDDLVLQIAQALTDGAGPRLQLYAPGMWEGSVDVAAGAKHTLKVKVLRAGGGTSVEITLEPGKGMKAAGYWWALALVAGALFIIPVLVIVALMQRQSRKVQLARMAYAARLWERLGLTSPAPAQLGAGALTPGVPRF